MAPRIPVVFSQAAGLSPQQRDHEESLIAELLMEDRIEVSLIGAIERLEEGDTDRLCLLGFQGDFVLLTALDSSRLFAELERLGVEGRQGATKFEPRAGLRDDQKRRTIYHIPLDGPARSDVRAEVRRLREDSQIAVVPLLGIDGATPLGAISASLGSAPVDNVAVDGENSDSAIVAKPSVDHAGGTATNGTGRGDTAEPNSDLGPVDQRESPAGDNRSSRSQPVVTRAVDEWERDAIDVELDSLVDELDEMDL